MAYSTQGKASHRAAILAAVTALHVALLLIVSAMRAHPSAPPLKPSALSLISIAAEAEASMPPPPPSLPSKLVAEQRPIVDTPTSVDPNSSATSAAGAGCATLEALTAALLADATVIDAARLAPPETRSIADAIVMWNERWSDSAASISAPLGAIRSATDRMLQSVDDRCLDEPVTGPRFVLVPIDGRNVVLVFGSGRWSWRTLMFVEGAPDRAAFYARTPFTGADRL